MVAGYTDDPKTLLPLDKYVLFGDHTLEIKYVDVKFAQGADGLKILKPLEEINPRYFYYACCQFKIASRGYSRHWQYMKEVEIPVPPLAVQEEIVAILDRFETLVNDLSVGLPAELAARRRQYEYYRDRLLTFQPLEQKP